MLQIAEFWEENGKPNAKVYQLLSITCSVGGYMIGISPPLPQMEILGRPKPLAKMRPGQYKRKTNWINPVLEKSDPKLSSLGMQGRNKVF